ncbi:MAG: SDR family NAD(P)-dependent oxidoreductase [Clostridia bacterium]|nr:SDR family NAD(P)-dependent oxidoreductase [Clostridia bacterium]
MDIAIISGASGGIGKEFALLLDSEMLDEIWLICGKKSPDFNLKVRTRVFNFDLTQTSSFNEIKKEFSNDITIKYLICSAGVGYNGDFVNISEENISKMISLNCDALAILTKICIPYMKPGSKIIEIASGAGFLPQPSFATYAATKAFVISLSKALNSELKHLGISVTAVCPGPVDTCFFSSLDGVKEYKKKYLISPKRVAYLGLKASKKGKRICSTSFSIKMVHLAAKILPTSLIFKFYK